MNNAALVPHAGSAVGDARHEIWSAPLRFVGCPSFSPARDERNGREVTFTSFLATGSPLVVIL
jgi:hypothetical protein